MTLKEIAKLLDHSTLQSFLTDDDIRRGCDIALKYETATVCARPGDMKIVVPALKGSTVLPCTVIGFPHGAHTTDVKVYESQRALEYCDYNYEILENGPLRFMVRLIYKPFAYRED